MSLTRSALRIPLRRTSSVMFQMGIFGTTLTALGAKRRDEKISHSGTHPIPHQWDVDPTSLEVGTRISQIARIYV